MISRSGSHGSYPEATSLHNVDTHSVYIDLETLLLVQADGMDCMFLAANYDGCTDGYEYIKVGLKFYQSTTGSFWQTIGLVNSQYELLGFYFSCLGIVTIFCGFHCLNIIRFEVIFSILHNGAVFIWDAGKWAITKLKERKPPKMFDFRGRIK